MKKLVLLVMICSAFMLHAKSGKTPYLDRAEYIYRKVWNMYRVPKYGLFSEYYPNSYKPDLTYFQDNTGKKAQEVSFLWPMSGVFSATNVLMELNGKKYKPYQDSMVVAVGSYYDNKRTPPGYQAYPVRFEKSDRYYDDNGLVGIDYIDSYNTSHNKQYLAKAKEVFDFIKSGWSNDFGGGVSWLEGIRDQKPACSNGKATVLALKLYQSTKDAKYLEEGKLFYNWMMGHLGDSTLHIIRNSLSTINGKPDNVFYTYNTGTMIQSSVRLYKITGDKVYLDNAQQLAEGSYRYFIKKTDKGVPYIDDLPWFVVVLFRGYQELYGVDHNPKYVNAIIVSADWAWKNARDESGLIYKDWTGRKDEKKQPKWLLDESCMAELYARIAILKGENK
ncbi:MAG: glycoside hydrolase family 76 protein [Bacteroidota bacterium]|nr:glycoside hydrolase family 76 protein [Bacteroidota bacterium]